MLISLILIAVISIGGMSLTYLVAANRPLMWRLAAGTIIASSIFGTLLFIAASIAGLNLGIVLGCLAITASPVVLLRRSDIRQRFRQDRQRAGGKLQGANAAKVLRFVYYAFFLLLFWAFFERTYFELADGIYTGGSQNLGDLPFHLGAIFSFTDGNNFPPQNPSWAGAKFAYPFIADLLTAGFMTLGADLKNAMLVQNVAWAFSLLVLIERFTFTLTGSRLAGRIAPALLFLSGGFGFIWFFKDYWESGKAFLDVLSSLPRDYTIGDQFRWGNSMVVLFMTQRSMLLGLPLTIIVLGYLWRVFSQEDADENGEKGAAISASVLIKLFAIGMLAGMLPLIHLHSLATLFVVTGVLFLMRPKRWKVWIAFGLGVSAIAVPELIWSVSGTASDTAKFFDWHFGWDKREDNFLWFWFKNTGIVLPMIAIGAYFLWNRKESVEEKSRARDAESAPDGRILLLFYVPFVLLFVISNAAKLAPWEWDNVKVLFYWYVGSIPLIAYALAYVWKEGRAGRILSLAAMAVLVMAGSLDVWRTVSGQIKYRVFDSEGIALAQQFKRKAAPRALILHAPTYNSPIVLTGRQSLMRYSGHLSSHGIDYLPREADVKRIYEGGGVSDLLLSKYNIDYVLVSPEERNALKANEQFFKKYPVYVDVGQYRLYKIK